MTDTAAMPTAAAEWRPVTTLLAELTGSDVQPRTVASWAKSGLQTLVGPRGVRLSTRQHVLDFLRGRVVRPRTPK